MKVTNTAERLKQLMKERQLKQTEILAMAKPYCNRYSIKLGKSDLSQFTNGKVEPGQSKLTVLGLALGVSEAWLMGYDVPMERENAAAEHGGPHAEPFNPLDADFYDKYSRLSPEQKKLITHQIEGILASYPDQK